MQFKRFVHDMMFYLRQFRHFATNKNISRGVIFCLHRVDKINSSRLMANENMKISPSDLDFYLSKFEKKFDFIRVEDVPSRLRSNIKKPFIAFSLDDGYKDNLTQALAVFKKHNCPFTIFLTSSFPDNEAILWWYELENLLLSNKEITLSNGVTYPAQTFAQKEESFMRIREEILRIEQTHLVDGLNQLFKGYNVNWYSMCEKLSMSWSDIQTLKEEPLVTIGAHTQHHYNLKALETEQDVLAEVKNGWYRIKEMTGIESPVFAYPFGAETECSDREFKVLKQLSGSFLAATKAVGGPITNNHLDMYSLPRVMLYKGFEMSELKGYNKFILNLL